MKTREILELTGTTYNQVNHFLRSGRLPRPQKDVCGDYLWTDDDLANLRAVLATSSKGSAGKPGVSRHAG